MPSVLKGMCSISVMLSVSDSFLPKWIGPFCFCCPPSISLLSKGHDLAGPSTYLETKELKQLLLGNCERSFPYLCPGFKCPLFGVNFCRISGNGRGATVVHQNWGLRIACLVFLWAEVGNYRPIIHVLIGKIFFTPSQHISCYFNFYINIFIQYILIMLYPPSQLLLDPPHLAVHPNFMFFFLKWKMNKKPQSQK